MGAKHQNIRNWKSQNVWMSKIDICVCPIFYAGRLELSEYKMAPWLPPNHKEFNYDGSARFPHAYQLAIFPAVAKIPHSDINNKCVTTPSDCVFRWKLMDYFSSGFLYSYHWAMTHNVYDG